MDADQREQMSKWLDSWRDPEFIRAKTAAASIDLCDPAQVARLFEGPLKVASMLVISDPNSGLFDMQVWLARMRHEANLRGVTL